MPKIHIRVTASGKKLKKVVCPDGQKASNGHCVPMKAAEKLKRKKGAKKAVRKKSAHANIQRAALRAMRKALKKRKARGL